MKYINKELLKNNIENIALYDLKENNIFGSSYIVYQDGKVIFKKHYGTTSPETEASPNDKTLYR